VAKVGTSNPDRTISLKRLQCLVGNSIHGQVKFVGNKRIHVYQLHRGGTILTLRLLMSYIYI
jgi:hypothetical protein